MSTTELSLQPKQGEAFSSEATEILYGGAAGGGKSHLMRVAFIAWCTAIPGLQCYLFRRTYPDLWRNHMEGAGSFPMLLADWVDQGYAKIVGKEIRIGKSKIHLCHCEKESDVYKYQGAEMHVLGIDELTHFSQFQYSFLRSRVRLGGQEIPPEHKGMFPRVLTGSNPGNLGHNWVKAAFIDPAAPMEIWQVEKKNGGMRRQFIPALLADNQVLTENDPDYIHKLDGLGTPDLVRAMRDGDWNIVAGGMFDDVWREAVHVIEPFDIPESWTMDRSFDWGSAKPFSVGWWAQSDGTEATMKDGSKRTFPKGTLFRIEEWYGWTGRPDEGSKMSAADIAEGIVSKELVMGWSVRPGPADDAIYVEENNNCIADDMREMGVHWVRANKKPGTRMSGWESLRAMMKASLEGNLEKPGLYVFSNCRDGFIRTIPTLPRSKFNPEDVDSNAEDHVADEARYRVMAMGAVITSSAMPWG